MKHIHGERNFQLCQTLLTEAVYLDWAVTTAFYSSIHYFDHYFFPLTHNGSVYDDIGEIHKELKCPSKHWTRAALIDMYFSELVANYNFLDKACRNARYQNYNVPIGKAKQVKSRLDHIKKRCIEMKPIVATP